jgi:hypothetical protein
MEWSASLQRRISAQWGAEIDYTGSHTVHETQYVDENAPVLPRGPEDESSVQSRRTRFPQWGEVSTWAPIGWAKYNGLVASIHNTGWHGLSLMANFTWAKNIVSEDFGNSEEGLPEYQYPYIWAGDAAFTPRKRFVSGYSYQLPLGRGMKYASNLGPVLNKAVAGWSFSGITEFSTGSMYAVFGNDDSGTAMDGAPDPNRLCNPAKNIAGGRNRMEWFNTSCFTEPAYGTFGNSPLGAITEPGINNWELSLDKSTPIGFPKESGHIDFRIDAFNAFNKTQWSNPDWYEPDTTFGQIFSTRTPRQLQFTLKYVF